MISAYDFYLPNFTSEIINLIIFSEFLNFIHMISKLSISFNHTEHPKKLGSYYILPFFTHICIIINIYYKYEAYLLTTIIFYSLFYPNL